MEITIGSRYNAPSISRISDDQIRTGRHFHEAASAQHFLYFLFFVSALHPNFHSTNALLDFSAILHFFTVSLYCIISFQSQGTSLQMAQYGREESPQPAQAIIICTVISPVGRANKITIEVERNQMAARCPLWLKLQSESAYRDHVEAPWLCAEAYRALKFIVNRLSLDPRDPEDASFTTARDLFYLAEAFNWLGRPVGIPFNPMRLPLYIGEAPDLGERRFLCSADIQRLLNHMIFKARGLYNIEHWQLLGAVANRFGLGYLEAAIRRAVDIKVDEPQSSLGSGLTHDEEKVLEEMDILSKLFRMHWISCS